MIQRLLGFVCLFLSVSCGGANDGDDEGCAPVTHCHMEDGAAACDVGFHWQDPSDPTNFRCEPDLACPGAKDCSHRDCGPDPVCGLDCGTCDVQPEGMCRDANTAVTYSPVGSCLEGSCSYASDEHLCEYGCDMASGVCMGCEDNCPGANSTQCTSAQLQTCVVDSHGCLDWSTSAPCESGFCENESSCGECDNECSAVEDTLCDSANLSTCVSDAHGCLSWGPEESCPGGFCANGASCGTCDDQSFGTDDGCCPSNCTSATDIDCPMPNCDLPCIRFVDQVAAPGGDGLTWATAVDAIQPAIDEAQRAVEECLLTSCQVWVKEGTYYVYGSDPSHEEHKADSIVLKPGVELLGGFAGDETTFSERDLSQHRTTLDGSDQADGENHVYHVVLGDDDTVLDGFTIQGGRATAASGMDSEGGGMHNAYGRAPLVRNCIFTSNIAGTGGAVYNSSAGAIFRNTVFMYNMAEQAAAMYNNGTDSDTGISPEITNCTIVHNQATGTSTNDTLAGGIVNNHACHTKITNTILWKNLPNEISSFDDSYPYVRHSVVFGMNMGGDGTGGLMTTQGSFLDNPRLKINPNGSVTLRHDSPCIDAGIGNGTGFVVPSEDILGQARYDDPGTEPNSGTGSPDHVDIGAYEFRGGDTGADPTPCIRYVDIDSSASSPDGLSWTTAFTDLQQGIDNAFDVVQWAIEPQVCEIWVAEGTYAIYFTTTQTVKMRADVQLYGGFAGDETERAQRNWGAHETILDGCYSVCSADWRVNNVVIGSNYAALDGFTVTHGGANDGYDNNGGGMLNSFVCPEIRNTKFKENLADDQGGAIFSTCPYELKIDSCEFTNNMAMDGGAVAAQVGDQVTITNSSFTGNDGNEGNGGALDVYNVDELVLTDVVVSNNRVNHNFDYGGGLYAQYSSITLLRVAFDDNTAHQGGGIFTSGSLDATDSSFTNNTALDGHGGGIYSTYSSPSLTHCTFNSNYPDDVYQP